MDRQDLIRRIEAGEAFEYVFFWGHRDKAPGRVGASCMSQWYPAPFDLDGIRYATAEHFMMASKARLFGDDAILARILETDDPSEVKKLGRQVSGFEAERWERRAFEAVVEGNLAKFTQNLPLGEYLQSTAPRVLVEASPYDAIWGIALKATDERASDPRRWEGLNLLGFALMQVRDRIA